MNDTESKPLSFLIFAFLAFLIFLRPFFSGLAYPVLEFYYENIIIILGVSLLLFERHSRLTLKTNPCNLAISLLLAGYIVSAIFSINLQNSLKETFRFISCFSIFFIVSQTSDSQKNTLIKIIVASAVIISAYSIYQYFWGYQHTLDVLKKTNDNFLMNSPYARDILLQKRAIGTFPSPNIFAGYLIIAFFLACHVMKISNSRFALFQIAVISFAIILTKSFGAYLSLVIALITLFFFSYNDIKKQKLIAVLCLIAAGIGIAFIISNKWDRLTNLDNPHNPIIQRLNYWRISIAAIKDQPLLGIGSGNFQEIFLKYKTGWSIDTRYSHNIFLQTWLETGVSGLIAIGLLIIAFMKSSFRKSKYILLAGFAFMLHNLIDITYFIPETGLFWWVLLGLASRDT